MTVSLGAGGVHTSLMSGSTSAPCHDGNHRLCSGVVGTTHRLAYSEPTGDVVIRPCACGCGCATRGDVQAAAATVRARAVRA